MLSARQGTFRFFVDWIFDNCNVFTILFLHFCLLLVIYRLTEAALKYRVFPECMYNWIDRQFGLRVYTEGTVFMAPAVVKIHTKNRKNNKKIVIQINSNTDSQRVDDIISYL